MHTTWSVRNPFSHLRSSATRTTPSNTSRNASPTIRSTTAPRGYSALWRARRRSHKKRPILRQPSLALLRRPDLHTRTHHHLPQSAKQFPSSSRRPNNLRCLNPPLSRSVRQFPAQERHLFAIFGLPLRWPGVPLRAHPRRPYRSFALQL